MGKVFLVGLTTVLLVGCAATDQEAGMVLGSTAAGAGLGALWGAAMNPWNRNQGATSGALAGAAIGGAIGLANASQQRQVQYSHNYAYYTSTPPPPRNYRRERCVVTETTDVYGRVTTTEHCSAYGPSLGYRYY